MGLASNFGGDDSSNDDSNDEPGVSYLYIRDPGHSSNGPGHNETARNKLRGEGEFADSLGVADFAKKAEWQFGDQHDFFSQVVADVWLAINEDDYSDLFETLMVSNEQTESALEATQPNGQQIAAYLQANPEVQQSIIAAMAEHDEVPLVRADEADTDEADETETDEAEA